MRIRFARVVWWSFAVIAGLAIILNVVHYNRYDSNFFIGASVVFHLIGCCITYVLSGSFWKPPPHR